MENKKYKKIITHYLLPVAASCLLLIFSCGDDDGPKGPTAQETATQTLTSSDWSLANGGRVTLNSLDVTDLYTGMTVSFLFSSSTDVNPYGTTNSGGPNGNNRLFDASGTWSWADGITASVIHLVEDNSKSNITITELTENRFSFSFQQLSNRSTANGVEGLAGSYVVTLTR